MDFLVFELFICKGSLYSVEHSPDIETAVAYFINMLYIEDALAPLWAERLMMSSKD